MFDASLAALNEHVTSVGGALEYVRLRANVAKALPPRTVADEVRQAFLPVLLAVNNEVPGSSVLLDSLESWLRSNIPPGENRVPYIRERLAWFYEGRWDKLHAVSERRPPTVRAPAGALAGIGSRVAGVAHKAEALLGHGSLRSCKRLLESADMPKPELGAWSLGFCA